MLPSRSLHADRRLTISPLELEIATENLFARVHRDRPQTLSAGLISRLP